MRRRISNPRVIAARRTSYPNAHAAGHELEQTKSYADDPWAEKWWQKFEAGVGVGYGDGLAGEVHACCSGGTMSAQRDPRGDTYLLRKTWEFF